MNDNPNKPVSSTGSMLLASILIGILYWIVDTIFYFFTTNEPDLLPSLTSLTSTKEIWQRMIVLCFLAIFGSHVHYTNKKQRKAEEALRESEGKYRSLIENIQDGIYILDPFGKFTFVNEVIVKRSGFPAEWFLSRSYLDVISEEDHERVQRYFNAVMDGKTEIYDLAYPGKSGNLFHVEVCAAPLFDNVKVIGLLGISRDITDRKRAEEKIQASLREKDLLLNEIHHRVKNNLQVISGLLDLQARANQNLALIESFRESQNRIRAMALVHEKLYSLKDFSRIGLAGYVRSLSQELFISYNIRPGKIGLTIQTDGEVYVDINRAIPCGLIMNELISNALQYAFPGDGPGELQIILRETKSKEIEIVIRDNGLGLPDDVDTHEPRSLGLSLVNGLAKDQLDGQMEVIRDNGTEFRITFPL